MRRNWWKEGVIYQIYPQSFYDTNNDGIGDLQGIVQKLDYIKDLGVDILWINPIYASPLDDNGYDISDYRAIHPIYGTMNDFDELLEEIHKRDLRLLMDLVVNHSSDEHYWFQESRKSKDNPYRDYYFWRPGKNGGPPNNWPGIFGGSVWQFDEQTEEYYLHYFTKKQPDLNWENPRVREEIKNIMKWWLNKGIDGFRLDVIPMISKYLNFPDAETSNLAEVIEKYYSNGPRVHEFIREINHDVLSKYNCMTVGEGPGINTKQGLLYTGHDRDELNMIFPLDLMFIDWGPEGKFQHNPPDFGDIKTFFRKWNKTIDAGGWYSPFLDNHDFPRMVSRFADDGEFREVSTKMLLTMLLTMPGTPSIYYGSEIGMTNVQFDSIDDYRDVETLNYYRDARKQGMAEEDILRNIHRPARDNVRTPMQWSDRKNGGFSETQPWIKCNPNYHHINVARDLDNPDGIISYFRKLNDLRKSHLTFVYGSFSDLDPQHAAVFAYERSDDQGKYVVALNFSGNEVDYPLPPGNPIICNYPTIMNDVLRPWEARIYQIQKG